MKNPSLLYLAQKINAHLKRIEADDDLNPEYPTGRGENLRHFFMAGASVAGNRVSVQFVGYQGSKTITKAEAIKYLDWLNKGHADSWYTFKHKQTELEA